MTYGFYDPQWLIYLSATIGVVKGILEIQNAHRERRLKRLKTLRKATVAKQAHKTLNHRRRKLHQFRTRSVQG